VALKNMFEGRKFECFHHDFHHLPILTYFYGKRWYLGFVVVEVWQKRLVIVIDIYPVRQTHPGKLNDG
jgi:hypothetical protein